MRVKFCLSAREKDIIFDTFTKKKKKKINSKHLRRNGQIDMKETRNRNQEVDKLFSSVDCLFEDNTKNSRKKNGFSTKKN